MSASASASTSAQQELTLLICTANVGNAEPTIESFSKWIPDDGLICDTQLSSSTRYPVVVSGRNDRNDDAAKEGYGEGVAEDAASWLRLEVERELGGGGGEDDGGGRRMTGRRFDIIVIGMQEAAFLEKATKESGGGEGGTSDGVVQLVQSLPSDIEPSSRLNSSPSSKIVGAISTPFISSVQSMSNGVGMIGREGNRRRNKAALMLRSLGLTSRSTVYKSPVSRSPSTVLRELGGSSDAVGGGSGSYDTRVLHDLVENRCPSYRIVTSNLRGQMRLFVLALRSLMGAISDVYVNAENTGIGKVFANKGGIIATLDIMDTRLSFMTAHLAAHEGESYYRSRNSGMARILNGAKTDPNYSLQDASIISHHMFVCGDLNYRTNFDNVSLFAKDGGDGSIPSYDAVVVDFLAANGSHFDRAKELVDAEDWGALNDGDELNMALRKKECLVGFATLPCNFPPTFKVARGVRKNQYNEKRTPSYTDRILWKSADGLAGNVVPILYEPCSDFITSDHKPIRGGYIVKTNRSLPGHENMATTESAKHNERRLNLLVSDIECTNLPAMDSAAMGGLSDPYVLFASYPKSLLWKNGWKSTAVIPRNLNPVWKEMIHLEVDGDSRNSLVGSMLFMTVMDDDFNGADTIGTVALNLKDLCCNLNAVDNSNNSPSGRSRRESLTGSLTGGLIRKSAKNAHWSVQETKISRPILRNGLEFGMLKCTISTAYLTAKESKAFQRGHWKQHHSIRMSRKLSHIL